MQYHIKKSLSTYMFKLHENLRKILRVLLKQITSGLG